MRSIHWSKFTVDHATKRLTCELSDLTDVVGPGAWPREITVTDRDGKPMKFGDSEGQFNQDDELFVVIYKSLLTDWEVHILND